MISVNRRTLYGEVFNDVRCLSSDEKPTEGIKNGSTLIEIDTGKRYLYDALSGSWNEFSQGGGGGGEYVLPTMSQSVKGGATLGEGLSMSGDSLSVDYSKVASKQSLDDATKVDPDGGLKRTTEGLSVDYSEVASVDALEEATALSPTGGIVSTQDGLAISPEQSSTGTIDGALLELTAKSKPATQESTVGKNLLPENGADSKKFRGVTFTSGNGVFTIKGTFSTGVNDTAVQYGGQFGNNANYNTQVVVSDTLSFDLIAGTYTLSADSISDGAKVSLVYGEVGKSSSQGNTLVSIINSSKVNTFTVNENCKAQLVICTNSNNATVDYTISHIQLELGSTATPYEPYSGGAPSPSPDFPQPIVTVRGRNLLPTTEFADINHEKYQIYHTNDGGIRVVQTASVGNRIDLWRDPQNPIVITQDCLLRVDGKPSAFDFSLGDESSAVSGANLGSVVKQAIVHAGSYTRVSLYLGSATADVTIYPQLTLGSTPQPYVPYGHVGLERRDSQGTLLDTTPIPLPSSGWVAGLPDGTADTLALNGAGKVVWTEETDETTTAATDGITGTVGVDVMSTTGQIADGVTVLYKLATPVTEDCGYIEGWTNDFSEGCVLSIPELDDLGIKYHIDEAVSTLVHQWYEKSRSEYEDRLASLEDAVAQLIAEG